MTDPLDFLRRAATQATATPAPRTVGRRTEPSPADNPMAWADAAACSGMDPSRFFPNRGEVIDADVVAACQRCPVLADCRDWALRHERLGYWGGQSERSRRRLRKTLGIVLADEPTDTGDTAA